MPVVTNVKQQKNENRVNVYLDNRFGFGIDLDNYVLLGLKIGRELTDEEIVEIVKKGDYQKTYEKLLKFCLFRPRSVKEVSDWLKRKKVSETIWNDLIEETTKLDLLDDLKFAKWWVEQRNQYSPRSKKLLMMELKQKGIDREVILEALSNEEIDEISAAETALSRKKFLVEKLPDEGAKQKLIGFLARKGFSWEVIEVVIKRVTNN